MTVTEQDILLCTSGGEVLAGFLGQEASNKLLPWIPARLESWGNICRQITPLQHLLLAATILYCKGPLIAVKIEVYFRFPS
jgi:hypothetical protein